MYANLWLCNNQQYNTALHFSCAELVRIRPPRDDCMSTFLAVQEDAAQRKRHVFANRNERIYTQTLPPTYTQTPCRVAAPILPIAPGSPRLPTTQCVSTPNLGQTDFKTNRKSKSRSMRSGERRWKGSSRGRSRRRRSVRIESRSDHDVLE